MRWTVFVPTDESLFAIETGRRRRAVVWRCVRAGLCAAALQGAIPSAASADAEPPGFAKTLTGDWDGRRTTLSDRGVGVTLGYASETANNPRGGSGEKTRYTDQWAFGSKLDLQKLLGWNDAAVELVITDRDGRSLSDDANLHTLQSVQEVYGRGQTWRLTRLSYRQAWFDGRLDLRFGRLPEGDDFAVFPCNFQNLTFCGSQPGNVRGDLWYSYPVSQWGSRVKAGLGTDTSFQLGIYQVNPRYIDDGYARHGALYPNIPAGTTGALIPIEYAWKPTFGGLLGSYTIGGWYDTSKANDVFLDTNHQPIVLTGGTPMQRNSRSGVYLTFRQQINGRDKGRGGSVFLNVTQSDKATAPSMDRQIALGMAYRGPFDARPADTLGFALGSNHVNSRIADSVRSSNQHDGGTRPVPGSETVSELFYAWVPRPYVTLQPNVQYVRHPGGVGTHESVLVVGLRSSADF